MDIVAEHRDLLGDVPAAAVATELAFRDYVTRGVHRDNRFSPSVFELSDSALDALWVFVNHKAEFDMDASTFDDFNEAFTRRHAKVR